VERPGFRTKEIIVVAPLLDLETTTKKDLARLNRSRRSQELDVRDIKATLQMDVLRRKTPELVRKEIWTHLLAAVASHRVADRPDRFEPRQR
jgi:hypothetical protein